ncbi:MAG: esterase/lipase superfamily enzyme, partial [Myxococcota bacterium]
MNALHTQIDSPQLERPLHLWRFGHWGRPVLVLPSAAGFAHEWQSHGMVEVLTPLMVAGRLKLYCPESNVAESWTRKGADPRWRMHRHALYERWIVDTLVPKIRVDCGLPPGAPVAVTGCSLGAMYAANFALKHPETFDWALCMSGRYEVRHFLDGHDDSDVYFNNPLAYAPNLGGAALDRVRRNTFLTLVCGQGKWEEGCIEETTAL